MFTPANEHGQYRYLIAFAEVGLLRRQSGRAFGTRFDINAPGMRAVQRYLMAQHVNHRQAISVELGRALEVTHYYLVTHSGMAVWLMPAEVEIVAGLPGVTSIERERVYELDTYRSPWFIGADTVWDGVNTPSGTELRGEGTVIGILDTGIDPDHPSFANDSSCGHGSGGVPDKLISLVDCASTDESGMCDGPDPPGTGRHGSHVAGTAGGNLLDSDTFPPPEPPDDSLVIAGIAPCAHIRSYRVCQSEFGCSVSQIQAAMDSLLLHGDVDVMNFSISGGQNPWRDSDTDRRKLDLVDAGILVTSTAGNAGSGGGNPVGRVYHLGPWVLTVGGTEHDGWGSGGLLSVTGPGIPPPEIQEVAIRRGSHSILGTDLSELPIRRFDGQPFSAEGCTPGEDGVPLDMPPFPEGFFEEAAALIGGGGETCSDTTRIINAFNAGAKWVIIHGGNSFYMRTPGQPDIPAYSIPSAADGSLLRSFVTDNPLATTVKFKALSSSDVLGSFSSLGPTGPPYQNLTKPDIVAPGWFIYAAAPGKTYRLSSGTSMASPHVAGAAALVRQGHPDWSVPEVMSALTTTAARIGSKSNQTDVWDWDDVGSGRVDLTGAVLAGLVMHETFDNYLAADPGAGGDVRTLNRPSVRDVDCTPSCIWTRIVRNTLEVPSSWTATGNGLTPGLEITIEPESFTFDGDTSETRKLTITATPLVNLTEAVAFGEVVLSEASDLSPDQHITVAIRGTRDDPVIDVAPNEIEITLQEGQVAGEVLNIANGAITPETLDWAITTTAVGCQLPDWLTATPDSGALVGGVDETVEIHLDASTLAAGDYQAELCIDSNDWFTPQKVVPIRLTVILPLPSAEISPAGLEFELVANAAGSGILYIGNTGGATGNGLLAWQIATGVAASLPGGLNNPALAVPVDLPDFTLISPSNGGTPLEFVRATGVASPLEVMGFHFVGTASGISGTSTWASDTCMVIEAPDGSSYGVGGLNGVIDGCGGQNLWDFHGGGSDADGVYASSHDNVFEPAVEDHAGEWIFTFVQDWSSPEGVDITWIDVTVTLHLTPLQLCDDPYDAGWMQVVPVGGVTPGGKTDSVVVMVNSEGLVAGTHYAALCVGTNDPDSSLVVVPVTLTVTGEPESTIFSDRFEAGEKQ